MEKLKLHEEQACILATESFIAGIPQEYLTKVLQIASKGYVLGRADQLMGRPENEEDYKLESFDDAKRIADKLPKKD